MRNKYVLLTKYIIVIFGSIFTFLVFVNSGLFDKTISKYIRNNVVSVGEVELKLNDECYRGRILEGYINAILHDRKYLNNIIIISDMCMEDCFIDVRMAEPEEVRIIKTKSSGASKIKLAWDDIVLLRQFEMSNGRSNKMFFSEGSELIIFARREEELNCIASFSPRRAD